MKGISSFIKMPYTGPRAKFEKDLGPSERYTPPELMHRVLGTPMNRAKMMWDLAWISTPVTSVEQAEKASAETDEIVF